MLSVTSNKVQLIDIICPQIPAKIQESQLCSGTSHRVFIVGPEPTVIEVKMGVVVDRQDICITHEEADTMIPNIAVSIFQKGMSSVHVVVEDTDVFVLLTHFYYLLNIKGSLMMIPFSSSTTVTDIGGTVLKHSSIMPHLLSLHALTGCDMVPSYKNIGKPKALKVLKDGVTPPALGEGSPDYEQATM